MAGQALTASIPTAKGKNATWAELLQLLPIVSLALPFIIEGTVDLSRAGLGFLVGALLTIPVTSVVVMRNQLLNPILIGTGLWLWLGAVAFYVPVTPIRDWLTQTQAFGLFVGAFCAGIWTTAFSPHGYIACGSGDAQWLRRASLGLLALTAVTLGWAWTMRNDIRLGGGLPFIVLNVTRRILSLRAP